MSRGATLLVISNETTGARTFYSRAELERKARALAAARGASIRGFHISVTSERVQLRVDLLGPGEYCSTVSEAL
jgi:hypothetical protein